MATGKRGRPKGTLVYTNREDIKVQLVAWISDGKTLREFCRQSGMPNFSVIYDWEAEDKDFAQRIVRARIIGHDAIAEECAALSDTEPLAIFDDIGNKRYDAGSVAWRKMQIETRLKLLAKWNPRKYGDKTILAGDDENPVVVEASFDIFGELLKNMSLTRNTSDK